MPPHLFYCLRARQSAGTRGGKGMANKGVGYENVTYKTDEGVEITLSPETVRLYLTGGDAEATAQEIVQFIELCRHQRLNPFIREAYLIKLQGKPASILAGKDAFAKRAQRNEHFSGYTAGVVVRSDTDSALTERIGSLVLPNEALLGGWAKVFRKDWTVPAEVTVSIAEYRRGSSVWAGKPATMIRKVALVQALREAFPELSGLYAAEELDITTTDIAPAHMATSAPGLETGAAPTPMPVPAPVPVPEAAGTPEHLFAFLEKHEKVSSKGTAYVEIHLESPSEEKIISICQHPELVANIEPGQYISIVFAPQGRSKYPIVKTLEVLSPSNSDAIS